MTTIAFHNIYQELNQGNRLFMDSNASIGDDLLLPFVMLGQVAAAQGITVATLPTLLPATIDAYVFIDMPDPASLPFQQALSSSKPLYLIVLESPLVRPQNYDPANHGYFRRIFTYNDAQIDSDRFIKLNYSFCMPSSIPMNLLPKKKLCVMIAGYKSSRHPQELYGERLAAIKWFELNHPEDFDLYGVGWDKGRLGRRLPQWLASRIGWLGRLGAPDVPLYRGRVERKRDVMGRYRFALCYENIKDVPGYITEKLFDAFFAGTVPVYLGADNITDHVPADCFIDLRKFPDYSSLYEELSGMTDKRYLEYLEKIEEFINGKEGRSFSCEAFAETILAEIKRG